MLEENGVPHSQGVTQATDPLTCDGSVQRHGDAQAATPVANHFLRWGATMTWRKAWGRPSAIPAPGASRQGVALTVTNRAPLIAIM